MNTRGERKVNEGRTVPRDHARIQVSVRCGVGNELFHRSLFLLFRVRKDRRRVSKDSSSLLGRTFYTLEDLLLAKGVLHGQQGPESTVETDVAIVVFRPFFSPGLC